MRRALGKGLSQLIAEQFEGPVTEVPLDAIRPNPYQPRVHFDPEALQELAESIRIHGVLQPLAVRPLREGQYELIAGERRLRAARLALLQAVPVVVHSVDDKGALELALIENVQREDITPLESATAYQRLQTEFNLTQEQVAQRVGKSRAAVTNTLRLLKLPHRILEGLRVGKITEGHARALLQLENEPTMLAIYDQIVARGMTVREVEAKGQQKRSPSKSSKAPAQIDANRLALRDALATYFATPVEIEPKKMGGRIVIDFYSDDDLERILDVLGLQNGA